jgi:hypothetical protein
MAAMGVNLGLSTPTARRPLGARSGNSTSVEPTGVFARKRPMHPAVAANDFVPKSLKRSHNSSLFTCCQNGDRRLCIPAMLMPEFG